MREPSANPWDELVSKIAKRLGYDEAQAIEYQED